MIDIGWSELLVVGVVALIVVGPKDLPVMFRRFGEFTGKARAMAREFSSAMDKAADEAGVKDIKKDLNAMANPRQTGLDAINKVAKDLDDWDDDAPASAKPAKPAKPKTAASGPAADTATSPEALREAAGKKALERHARESAERAAADTATDDKTA